MSKILRLAIKYVKRRTTYYFYELAIVRILSIYTVNYLVLFNLDSGLYVHDCYNVYTYYIYMYFWFLRVENLRYCCAHMFSCAYL